jgi:signal transduction histidine kinase
MNCRETPLVSKIILLFVCLTCSFNTLKAQADPMDSIRYFLDPAKPYDSLRFSRGLEQISKIDFSDKNLQDLNTIANGYKRSNNLDTAFVLKQSILQILNNADYEKAISYGRKVYDELSTYTGPNASLLKGRILTTLRLPYRGGTRIGEGYSFFNDELKHFLAVKDSSNVSTCYYIIAGLHKFSGLTEQSIYALKKSLSWLNQSTYEPNVVGVGPGSNLFHYTNRTGVLGELMLISGDLNMSRQYSRKALELLKSLTTLSAGGYNNTNIFHSFVLEGQLDSAALMIPAIQENDFNGLIDGFAFYNQVLTLYHLKKKEYNKADSAVKQCYELVKKYQIHASTVSGYIQPDYYAALIRIEQKNYQEAIRLLELDVLRVKNIRVAVLRDYELLADLYTRIGDYKNANTAFIRFIELQKALQADKAKYATLSFETEQQIAANELALTNSRNEAELAATSRNYSIGIAALLVLLGLGIFARYRNQKKTNLALGKAMSELKASQTQLVHAEKMASLGELTAGIAHEIQNPLNFVNNFSETSKELLDEMKTALAAGDHAEATAIADDVMKSLEKINSHGKRADSIVKGMLQHSRSSTGTKEPTDLNSLTDEYLRLAYHGFRAKNSSFNALIKTDFDQSIGKVPIVPQDIGRVLLNLINNALYAVNEKKKELGDGFEPMVTVTTKLGVQNQPMSQSANQLIVSVQDNGFGIPESHRNKIFQPFFTTKPTNEGTGLGLSLSYDIIKAHGGEIRVNSKEGEGTEFQILLPSMEAS